MGRGGKKQAKWQGVNSLLARGAGRGSEVPTVPWVLLRPGFLYSVGEKAESTGGGGAPGGP